MPTSEHFEFTPPRDAPPAWADDGPRRGDVRVRGSRPLLGVDREGVDRRERHKQWRDRNIDMPGYDASPPRHRWGLE